jgi:anthranilate phosphoribosyltransferase
MSLLPYLTRLVSEENLPAADAEAAMQIILRGEASHPQIAAFLISALKMKRVKRWTNWWDSRAPCGRWQPIDAGLVGHTLLDTCGTGGDGCNTFNISTVAAFVVAGAGVHVAKHGNRSISSQCGSADLLEAGYPDRSAAAAQARAIREVGIGFLFAPAVHTAMKHAQPVRVDLKMRTVFNLLGPLTNPAGATAQLIGAPSFQAAELMAGAIAALGMQRGFVVHGSDGLDEITTTGPTSAWEIRDGVVEARVLEPGDFAVQTAKTDDLRGGDRDVNLEIANGVLAGARGPQRDIVLVNAAAALVAAGRAETFLEGMALGVVSIDSGAARGKVEALARFEA